VPAVPLTVPLGPAVPVLNPAHHLLPVYQNRLLPAPYPVSPDHLHGQRFAVEDISAAQGQGFVGVGRVYHEG